MIKKYSALLQLFSLLAVALLLIFYLSKKNTPLQIKNTKAELKLIHYNKQKSYPGLTLIPTAGTEEIFLIKNDGEIIHSWNNLDVARARLLEDCTLLAIHASKWGLLQRKWKEKKDQLTIYNLAGEPIWSYKADSDVHHDARRLTNGNLFFLEAREIPYPEDHPKSAEIPNVARIRSDTVREISPDGKTDFLWHADEHLDLVNCSWHGCEKKEKARKKNKFIWDWSHINTASPLLENRWHEGGDTRFTPGNFFIVPRSFWTAYLIDKVSGKVVWEYTGEKEGGLIRGHEMHMIEKGFPGEGNILVFDNGLDGVREYSRILEIDPITKETLWKYEDKKDFFSRGAGSVQRLMNGNTLISSDVQGRVFEVTSAGEVVWDFKVDHRISRAHRYELNSCKEFN